jgi:putative endonuclease
MWYIYILKCSDQTFYTGITTDVERRVNEHNSLPVGAKYTRCRRPVEMVYSRRFKTRQFAMKEELRIKRMPREEKVKLIKKDEKNRKK